MFMVGVFTIEAHECDLCHILLFIHFLDGGGGLMFFERKLFQNNSLVCVSFLVRHKTWV